MTAPRCQGCGLETPHRVIWVRCCRRWPVAVPEWYWRRGRCGLCNEVPEAEGGR